MGAVSGASAYRRRKLTFRPWPNCIFFLLDAFYGPIVVKSFLIVIKFGHSFSMYSSVYPFLNDCDCR